jgi:DnaJ-class molecular chaperone
VNRNASSGTIKKAYHKLALKYHPDKAKPVTGGEDPAAVFKRINEAYSKLKDPSNKRQYDMENSGGSRRRERG